MESAIKIQDGDNNRELLYEVKGDEAIKLLGAPDVVYKLKIDLYDGIEVSNDDLINCLSVINFTAMDSINVNDYMSCLSERYESKILCGSNKNIKIENNTTVNTVTFSVHH